MARARWTCRRAFAQPVDQVQPAFDLGQPAGSASIRSSSREAHPPHRPAQPQSRDAVTQAVELGVDPGDSLRPRPARRSGRALAVRLGPGGARETPSRRLRRPSAWRRRSRSASGPPPQRGRARPPHLGQLKAEEVEITLTEPSRSRKFRQLGFQAGAFAVRPGSARAAPGVQSRRSRRGSPAAPRRSSACGARAGRKKRAGARRAASDRRRCRRARRGKQRCGRRRRRAARGRSPRLHRAGGRRRR